MRKSARTQIPPFFDNDPYICSVMINWTVSSENCEKVILGYCMIGHFRKIF